MGRERTICPMASDDNMPIEIREARTSEYAMLGSLAVRAYRALGGFGADHPYFVRLADIAGRAADTDILVAQIDGALAGVVTFVPGPDTSMSEFDDPHAAGIRALAVDPPYQRCGVGRALTTACLERARATGRHRVILHSSQLQQAAQAMYLAMGFRREPELDWVPEPGVMLSGFVFELDS